MNRNNEDHRSPTFPALAKSVLEDVKLLFRTQTGTPFIFPSSGTTQICEILRNAALKP